MALDSMLSISEEKMRDKNGELFTELILEVFKLNGLLLAEGDRIAGAHELSSARWKVLGAVALKRPNDGRPNWTTDGAGKAKCSADRKRYGGMRIFHLGGRPQR